MNRFAWGITLTSAERGDEEKQRNRSSGSVKTHQFTVSLADGTTCSVVYTRYGRHGNRFQYQFPFYQQVWCTQAIEGGFPAVEEKGKELVVQALRQAQQEEQRQMTCRTPPGGHRRSTSSGKPPLSAKAAAACAGRYSVCVRFASGRLMRIGPLHEQPQAAVEEIKTGSYAAARLMPGQQIVIGIGCRWARCWKEPRFLSERVCLLPQEPAQADKPEHSLPEKGTPEPTTRAGGSGSATAKQRRTRESPLAPFQKSLRDGKIVQTDTRILARMPLTYGLFVSVCSR